MAYGGVRTEDTLTPLFLPSSPSPTPHPFLPYPLSLAGYERTEMQRQVLASFFSISEVPVWETRSDYTTGEKADALVTDTRLSPYSLSPGSWKPNTAIS